jgi:hypothetical protein
MNRLASLGLVGALVIPALSACSARDCADDAGSCRENELCHPATRLCVLNLPPAVGFDAPAPDAVITAHQVEVAGNATDDEGAVQAVELSLDDGATWTPVTLGEGGTFVHTLPLPTLDRKGVTVQVRATDRLGQQGGATLPLTVDNVAPRCDPIAPARWVVGEPDGPVVMVRYEATDGAGIASAVISVDRGVTFHPATIESGEARFAWTIPQNAHFETELEVKLTDANGNVCTHVRELVVDTQPPQGTLTYPTGAQPILVGGPTKTTVQVAVDAQDPSGLESVLFDFDDGQPPRDMNGGPIPGLVTLSLPEEDHVLHQGKIVIRDQAGNQTVIPVHLIVDRVAPVIANLAPTVGTAFNIASMGGQTAVTATWTSSDGDPALQRSFRTSTTAAWTPLTVDSVPIQTGATDNGKSYTLFVRAQDSLGHVTEAATEFTVDVVAPSFTFPFANNTRLTTPAVSVTFSEPVTPKPSAPQLLQLSVNPTQATGTLSGLTYTVPGLQGDTVYTATLPPNAVEDQAGNPNTAGAVTFHTRPLIPPSGTTLLTGDVYSFEAAADEEGVVTVLAWSSVHGHRLYWINPRTGILEERAQLYAPDAQATVKVQLVTASRVITNLQSDRVAGGYLVVSIPFLLSLPDTWWFRGFDPVQFSNDGTAVTVDRGCADPSAAARVGFVNHGSSGTYSRPGLPNATLNTPGELFAAQGPNNWAVFGVKSGKLTTTHRTCICGQNICGAFDLAELSTSPATLPSISAVVLGSRTLAVYNETAGRRETCYVPASPSCGICVPFTLFHQTPIPGQLHIAPRWEGERVLGARKNSGANVELLERDHAGGCFPAWLSLGTVPGSDLATWWRPIRVGNRPGVLYVKDGELKLHYW